jgi:hypothetical protein
LSFCASKFEGAGKAGRKPHPQPRARIEKAHELVTTGMTGSTGSPCAKGLTVSFVFSLVTGLFCHHRLQDHDLAGLISASGYRDHTTSPYAESVSSGEIFNRA